MQHIILHRQKQGLPFEKTQYTLLNSIHNVKESQLNSKVQQIRPFLEITDSLQNGFECLESWGKCVGNKDKASVLKLYVKTATLWPTLSNKLRENPNTIADYFDHFLPKNNGDVEWNQCSYQPIGDNHCIWSGIYTFNLTSGITQARFTYTLVKQTNGWKILHHHSSLMPE